MPSALRLEKNRRKDVGMGGKMSGWINCHYQARGEAEVKEEEEEEEETIEVQLSLTLLFTQFLLSYAQVIM